MKLFYCCYGSAHSSVTAANIHLGNLPAAGRPSIQQIANQPLFDRFPHSQLGTAKLMGTDQQGTEIYVLGLASGKPTLANALQRFAVEQGTPADQVRFESTLHHAGLLMRIGGYCSRRLGLVFPGRWLVAVGVWLAYPSFVAQALRLRRELEPT